jgi:3-dehydroquinate synthase
LSKVRVSLPENPYDVHIGSLKSSLKPFLRSEKNVFIISHPRLKRLWEKEVKKSVPASCALHWILVPEGEKNKTVTSLEKICRSLAGQHADRSSLVMAFGGGVIGDMAGLAAALYMRGIRCIQVPTTLLAMVDSSVGGKTAVDLPEGKNLFGAFYQPRSVFIDVQFLKTLSARDLKAGLAEVLKAALLKDAKFFEWLQKNHQKILNLDEKTLQKMIKAAVKIKADVVIQDEKEEGLRAILNLGHTFAHALEKMTSYQKYRHGEAVAMGIVFAIQFSVKKKLCSPDVLEKVLELWPKFGLPHQLPRLDSKAFLKAIKSDKKTRQATLEFILVEKIGKAKRLKMKHEDVAKFYNQLKR